MTPNHAVITATARTVTTQVWWRAAGTSGGEIEISEIEIDVREIGVGCCEAPPHYCYYYDCDDDDDDEEEEEEEEQEAEGDDDDEDETRAPSFIRVSSESQSSLIRVSSESNPTRIRVSSESLLFASKGCGERLSRHPSVRLPHTHTRTHAHARTHAPARRRVCGGKGRRRQVVEP